MAILSLDARLLADAIGGASSEPRAWGGVPHASDRAHAHSPGVAASDSLPLPHARA